MLFINRNCHEIDPAKVNSQNQPKNPRLAPQPTLNQIQIRANRVHQRHGAVGGGYTLEDWLEAEHELENERDRN